MELTLFRGGRMKFARVALVILLLAACDIGRQTFRVQNHTESAIDVWFVSAEWQRTQGLFGDSRWNDRLL
jgi:hypothetical protein